MKFFNIIIAILVGLTSTLLYTNRNSAFNLVNPAIESITVYYTKLLNTFTNSSSPQQPPAEAPPAFAAVSEEHSDIISILKSQNPQDYLFATEMSVSRGIKKVVYAIEQAEGAGALIRRSIGGPSVRNFSPFLMLDHFNSSDNSAGFPDHPHRGQETITYLINGSVDHEDFAGNRGTLNSGDLQFMTAGRGIVHAEMPRTPEDGSPMVGFQLWVDLPKELKYCEPRYRDLRAAEIPKVETDDGRVTIKVISGQSHGVDSVKDLAYTPVWFLDLTLKPGGKVTQPLPAGWNAFSYVYAGEAYFGEGDARKKVETNHNVIFEQAGDVVHVEADPNATSDAKIIIVAGTPLDQPIVQYGPFVVNTKEEVYQALMDYQTHSNGFERAENWQSEISKPVRG